MLLFFPNGIFVLIILLFLGETDWSDEATAAFQQISQGQILQGYICGYAENRIPYVRLFKITGANVSISHNKLCFLKCKEIAFSWSAIKLELHAVSKTYKVVPLASCSLKLYIREHIMF